jgi:hypothetical protein
VANCRLRLALAHEYSASDAEVITLQKPLNAGQSGSGHSKGVWTAMRWTAVCREHDHGGIVKTVFDANRKKQSRKKKRKVAV